MTLESRITALDWPALERSLWDLGYAEIPSLLTEDECRALDSLYPDDELFRSRVDMARHNFGVGEYKYFRYPLPPLVHTLRTVLYAHLAPIATAWEHALRGGGQFPTLLDEFLAQCRQQEQPRPTPLLLRYEEHGFNCLHQDLYGDVSFPLQATAFLSQPGVDFSGGEFLLVEQRPRAQSIGQALQPVQGSLIIFATRYRPVRGSRGYYRSTLRHGVSRIRHGRRATLGIIFHDAR